ncbi:MAG: hypothetical protein KatS3mg043_0425 [Rhodothermaceae bacterium]|nr:MAG: hypothetical protein KatS3mg043_0425 [Rhodothermaceae bacterium]
MTYGERIIARGAQGPDVEELQLRLAGFRGTVPDGDFGPITEMQVMTFQRDVMGLDAPTGIADGDTLRALDAFADAFPLDFDALRCPCGACPGFGRGRFRGSYRGGRPHTEAFHRYEYPGIHRMLLWAVRAVFFYLPHYRFLITSGYRCGVRNLQTGRTSTNHHGKAIDIDVARRPRRGQARRHEPVQRDPGRHRAALERPARLARAEHEGARTGPHRADVGALRRAELRPALPRGSLLLHRRGLTRPPSANSGMRPR